MTTTTRYFGAHVSVAGGLEKALDAATALKINTIQVHPTPPQKWNSKPVPAGAEDAFNARRAASGVERVFFHGIYLINLATPDKGRAKLAHLSLKHDLELLARIKGDGLVFHVGSAKDAKDLPSALKDAAGIINDVLADSPAESRLILEVAAGGGSVIGAHMEELATIYGMIKDQKRVGFGLDTQHLWASGYDLTGQLERCLEDVTKNFGWDKVWSIHLNDSLTALASRKDRHANLGAGLIGTDTLQRFLRDERVAAIPTILETPGLKAPETAGIEVETLRQWLSNIK